jgi:hypothetical protein
MTPLTVSKGMLLEVAIPQNRMVMTTSGRKDEKRGIVARRDTIRGRNLRMGATSRWTTHI